MGLSELLALQRLKENSHGKTLPSVETIEEEIQQKEIIASSETYPLAQAFDSGLAEVIIKKKNIILDASMFTSYMACARLFNFVYNMQLIDIDGKGNSLEAGSIAHAILEIFYTNLINGFSRSLSIAAGMTAGEEYYFGCLDCKQSKCIKHKKSDPYLGCKNVPMESDKYEVGYNWIVKTMEEYFQHTMSDPYIPLESESVKGKVLYEDDEIRILWKAKIDVIVTNSNMKPTSMDHKTRKIDRKMGDINNQFMGQCLIMGTNNVIVNKIGWQKSLKPAEKFVRETMSYTYDRLAEWKNETLPTYVYKFLHSIDLDRWDPNNTHCENRYGFCDFYEVCRVDRSLREGKLKELFMVGPKWDPSNE